MRVLAKKSLVTFYTAYPDAKVALEDWYEKTARSEWDHFAQMRQSFRSVDSVGNKRYVFNIKGNRYRLVALVLFKIKMVYVRFIGTHDMYDQLTNIDSI